LFAELCKMRTGCDDVNEVFGKARFLCAVVECCRCHDLWLGCTNANEGDANEKKRVRMAVATP